jgi:tRNA(Arg) A34 adenosine deaminase TadA
MSKLTSNAPGGCWEKCDDFSNNNTPILNFSLRVTINLPSWAQAVLKANQDKIYNSDEEMMCVAVDLAAENITRGGGPFGCAIYERDISTGKAKLFSVGCNQVVAQHNSSLHGEMVAIQFAQKKLKTFSLKGAKVGKEFVLCTSAEPCCMCIGGTMWSGVTELICAATKADAEAIGFQEGPVYESSYKELESMGIKVKREVNRAGGAAVLQKYGQTGLIYVP